MFSILDFIDSKDIREYNKDTLFTPFEQAVLIHYSQGTAIDEKLSAWRELLAAHSEEEFEQLRFGKRYFAEKSNKQIIADTVTIYENALAQRERADGVVFEANFNESDFPDNQYPHYFPDYPSAFAHIKDEKQYYLDDEDLCQCQTQARIAVKEFNTQPQDDTVFYFDNEMRMTDLLPGRCVLVDDEYLISEVFIYIPLPFRKGDILCSITPGKKDYGILHATPDVEYYARPILYGDASDMIFSLDTYEPDDAHGYFGYGHFSPLDFEKCPDEELPEELSILKAVRSVHQEKLEFHELLYYYSRYGENAYREMAHFLE